MFDDPRDESTARPAGALTGAASVPSINIR
jgi:hypothetical protein